MFKPWKSLATAALLVHGLVAMAGVTGLKYVSTAGDYIGEGQSQTLKPPAATVSVSGSSGEVQVSVNDPNNWWSLNFAAPRGAMLTPGSYAAAARYPFQSPLAPGLDMSGNGRGCNTLKGWFKVLEYLSDDLGNVKSLAIDFVQNCEVSGPPLYGAIRYRSQFPLTVPVMAAVAGADFGLLAGDTATLDGSQSFSRKAKAPLSYQWTQLDGPAVTLNQATSAKPSFVAPEVPLEGASLRFQLTITDPSGATATDDVVVAVQSPLAARTEVSFHGDAGDWITGGGSFRYTPGNATINFRRNNGGGLSLNISGDTWWYLDTAPAEGKNFRRGHFKDAQRYPFQEAGHPGLSLWGSGRGCNTLTGKFTVYQATFNKDGSPAVLEMDFEQHCEGGLPAAYGRVLMNAVPHAALAQQLREARQKYRAAAAR